MESRIEIDKFVSCKSAIFDFCKKWVYHLLENGLEVIDNVFEDVSLFKKKYAVPDNLRSCYSAKINKYTMKGHVPFKSIQNLFKENKVFSGIVVPCMPLGTIGMEMHSYNLNIHNYENFSVFSFIKKGKIKIFDTVSSPIITN